MDDASPGQGMAKPVQAYDAAPLRAPKVLLAFRDKALCESVQRALQRRRYSVARSAGLDRLGDEVRALRPDVVVVRADWPTPASQALAALGSEGWRAGLGCVVVLPHHMNGADLSAYRDTLPADRADIIVEPFTAGELHFALRRLLGALGVHMPDTIGPGEILPGA